MTVRWTHVPDGARVVSDKAAPKVRRRARSKQRFICRAPDCGEIRSSIAAIERHISETHRAARYEPLDVIPEEKTR